MKNRRLPPPVDRLVPDVHAALLLGASLVLATLFWAGTAGLQTAPREFLIPLTFSGLPEDRVVTGDMARSRVAVVVRGTPELLKRVTEEDIQVRVDASGMAPGPHVAELTGDCLRLPNSVELERVVPSTVRFTVDRKVRRDFPLEPAFVGRSPKGLQVLSWAVDPPRVAVEGPESVLKPMQRVPTQPVPLEGQSQGFEAAVVAAPASEDVDVVNPQTHRLRVTVGEVVAQRAVAPVPVRALRAPEGSAAELSPSTLTVMVEGPQSLAAGLGPQDLVAEVDLRGLAPSSKPYQLKPAVRLADPGAGGRVEVTSWIPKYVEVTVRRQAAAGGAP